MPYTIDPRKGSRHAPGYLAAYRQQHIDKLRKYQRERNRRIRARAKQARDAERGVNSGRVHGGIRAIASYVLRGSWTEQGEKL